MFRSQKYKIRDEIDPSYIHYEKTLKNINKFNKFPKFIRYKIIRLIEKVVSEEILDNDKEFYLSSLDRKFIHWNNNEAQKLTELTDLNTNDWIIQ
tara:strand:- start:274 stop:558 length:285 start_codon:yes stop_codon:yes gene_type:complete